MQTIDIQSMSSGLVGSTVVAADRIYGGRNSQVFKLTCEDSTRYALKLYLRDRSDGRDRLGVEFSGLRFLWENGVRCVPRPVAADEQQNCGVYEFVDGVKILPDEVTEAEIDQSVRFLSKLNELKRRDGSRSLPAASEACFSADSITANIALRLERLQNTGCAGPQYDRLGEFLADEFEPLLDELTAWSEASLGQAGTPFDGQITDEYKTLSPSDFGFHNALNRAGEVVFLDFEYFGWDDPAKMLSDFLLHPAMPLPDSLRRRFVDGFLSAFHDDGRLAGRLMAVYPLFGLKWCLILLNEFIPEGLRRRELAGVGDMDHADLQYQQLTKAREMLTRVSREYKDFPYYA